MNRPPFFLALLDLLKTYWPKVTWKPSAFSRALLPTPGNVLFTLLAIAALIGAQNAGAFPGRAPDATSTGTVAYQGRLADSGGAPLTATLGMIFRLYNVASGGSPLWEEQWTGPNSVRVSDGLFNVMLGSLTPIPQSVMTGNNSLWLGITVGADNEMAPRVQLGSVPFAVQALTVPDGTVTRIKLGADVAIPDTVLDGIAKQVLIQSGLINNTPGSIPGYVNVTFSRPFKTGSIPRVVISPNSYGGFFPGRYYVVLPNNTSFQIYRETEWPVSWDWVAIGEP